MSRYGIDLYGEAKYGAAGLIDLDASPFLAVARNHGALELSWVAPSGTYDRLRVVRNAYGSPVNADDGSTVIDVPASPSVTLHTDTGLSPGQFYYYAIFARRTDGWIKVASTYGLVVTDHRYTELLLDRLPSVYTTTPASAGTRADQATQTPLVNRFLSLFGFQLDAARTTLETLRDNKDADRVGSPLLPLLASELGQTYEPAIGERQMRVLLRNTAYLYKKKGTGVSVTGLASALTGWGADLLPVTNIMLDEDFASAESTLGNWHVRSGPGVLTRRVSDALANDNVIPPGSVVGYRNAGYTNTSRGMFQLTESGTGAVVLAHVRETVDADAVRYGIPIDPTKAVTASVFLRDTGTSRAPTLALDFYDRRGGLLAAPTATASAGATASDWTRRQQVVVTTPPATAAYVGVRLTYPVAANGEVQLFDAFQVEQVGAPTAYNAARRVRVSLSPDRTNLITNPSAEVNTTGWTQGASTTLTRSTLQKNVGSASFRLVPLAGVRGSMSTTYTTTAATAHVHSVFVYGAAGTYDLTAGTGGTAVISATVVPANTWTRISVARTSATGEATTQLTVTGPTGAEFFVDMALAEKGTAVQPYFDGATTGSLDAGWTGTAHASSSVLYVQRAIRHNRLRANIARYLAVGTPYELVYADGYSA